MSVRPTNIFNAVGSASQEQLRELLYHALSGNETILTPFEPPKGVGTSRKAEAARQKRDEEFMRLVQFTLATQERIERIARRIELLDQASAEALIESEERLRKAREELRQIKERAYEVTMPDGSVAKVYRDGDLVRNDSGAKVDPSVIRANDIPDSFPRWHERQGKEQVARDAERGYKEVVAYRERLASNRRRLENGALTDRDADTMEADIERMPASVRRHYERLGGAPAMKADADRDAKPESVATFDTDKRPTQPFATAATVKAPLPAADLDFTNIVPNVSTPAPK